MDIKEILASVKDKGDTAVLNIYGDIAESEWDRWYEDDISPDFVSKFLDKANGKELHVHINSGGGAAFGGIAIYNILKAREGRTITHVDGLAASAASIIAFAGEEIRMPLGSMLMIHEPWSASVGNSTELRHQADVLDKLCENMLDIYIDRLTDKSEESALKIKELVAAETWLNSEECKDLFDGIIVEDNLKACACIKGESMAHYKLPKGLVVKEAEGDNFKNENDSYPRMSEDEKKKLMLMEIEIEAELC